MAVYLDFNATTPVDPRVVEAMLPHLAGPAGNPSSVHRFGRAARAALEQARAQVAALVGAQPDQVIFTSGGTEANNLAIRGVHPAGARDAPIAVSAVEHASVLAAARRRQRHGRAVRTLEVDAGGRVRIQSVRDALEAGAVLLSVMWANNETGVLQPVAEIAALARAAGAILHTDAVQAAGKVPVDFPSSGVHLMTLSAHKIYGPQGVGALIADAAVDLAPLVEGGGQERGRRGGTENLAGIVGFGAAAELARREREARATRMRGLRDALERALAQRPGTVVFAADAERLPNTVQFAVSGIAGETLVLELDRAGVAVSSGSACHSGRAEPSHVLAAMGVARETAYGAVRVSFGAESGPADLDALLQGLDAACARLAAGARAVP